MRRNRALFPQNRRSPRQIGDFCLFDDAARIGLRGIQLVNCGFGVMSDVQPGFSGLGADVLRVGFIRFLMKSVVGGFCQLFCVFQHAVPPLLFAVGDGNHSLATAKRCYEELKKNHPGEDLSNHPARYALVELENIHDPAQVFEPIHRVIFKTEPQKLLAALKENCCAETGFPVKWYIGKESGTVHLDKSKGELAVGVLQHFLDEYLKNNPGEIDYIHDDDALIELAAKPDAIGFLLPAMEKSQLFRGVIADGILPRKTFSMGHSREKRYYLEGRKIK